MSNEQSESSELGLSEMSDLWGRRITYMLEHGQISTCMIVDIPLEDVANNPGQGAYLNRRIVVTPHSMDDTFIERPTSGNISDVQIEIYPLGGGVHSMFDNTPSGLELACKDIENGLIK